jgi:hypothetical protein
MERRVVAHPWFRSGKIAPTRRMTAASLGKMPTSSLRRSISFLSRSRGLVLQSRARWAAGQPLQASMSAAAFSMGSAGSRTRGLAWSAA